MSAKTKIDSSDKTWEDGYACKQRVNFGGKADVANMKKMALDLIDDRHIKEGK
jgi:hypothetical protein